MRMNLHTLFTKCLQSLCILFLLVATRSASKKSPSVRHSKVLVLGAGMSGITAAKTLHDKGIQDLTILEGYDRVGGRMRKAEFGGATIELGANWIQGTKNNPLWDLAQKYRLRGNYTIPYPKSGYYIVRDEQGKNVTDDDNHEKIHEAYEKLDEIIEKRRNEGLPDIDVKTGLRLAGWQAQNPAQSSSEYFYVDFDAGVPPHYVSAKVKSFTNGSIDSEFGMQFFVFDSQGYAFLVEEMARSFLKTEDPRGPRLLFNQVVDHIEWDTNGVQVSTVTGQYYSAEYLLITFSIGVLKSNAVKFTPDLPPNMLEPIYKIEMANYIKIFLKFPHRFWDKKQYIFYASKRRGYYPIWQDLEVDAGLQDKGLNILIVTVTGEEASRVQYQSDKQTQLEIMEVLRNVYGKDIPDPIAFTYPRWQHDPLFYGCYSNNPIGISHEDYVALASNVSRMYFAGEATNELYNGFVHGAYYSGLNRAVKMAKHIKANENHHFKH